MATNCCRIPRERSGVIKTGTGPSAPVAFLGDTKNGGYMVLRLNIRDVIGDILRKNALLVVFFSEKPLETPTETGLVFHHFFGSLFAVEIATATHCFPRLMY